MEESLVERAAPRVAKVYVFPHELPTKDYFWGGYISLIVTEDHWVFETPEETEREDEHAKPAIRKIEVKRHTDRKAGAKVRRTSKTKAEAS